MLAAAMETELVGVSQKAFFKKFLRPPWKHKVLIIQHAQAGLDVKTVCLRNGHFSLPLISL